MELAIVNKKETNDMEVDDVMYSHLANRRGGRLLIFRNFPDPPELIRTPGLLILKKKIYDQEGTQILKISKRVGTWKKFRGGGNQKGRKYFEK